jgi:protein-tyrosine-phosphatase
MGAWIIKCLFICNQNQARSQFLSAVFSRLLSAHKFDSFGLIAKEGSPLPIVINAVFKDMGLDPDDRSSKNMGLHWDEIQNVDIVIAATNFIADQVSEKSFNGQLINLEYEAALLGIELFDPQLMPRRQCAFELAKYLKVAYSALQRLGYIQSLSKITALIPARESSIGKALEIGLAEKTKESIILYGDFLAPRNDLFKEIQSSKYRFIDGAFQVLPKTVEKSSQILLPRHSVLWPSKTYLSQAWFRFLDSLAPTEITLITPPMMNETGAVAESYLCALGASQIQIIS